MAALISGGVNALQGKRGSDLLKSTIKDTAIAAVLGGVKLPGGEKGISTFTIEKLDDKLIVSVSGVES